MLRLLRIKYSLLVYLLLFSFITITSSCEDALLEEVMVYSNDFSTGQLSNIENGRLDVFEGDTVIGFYNAEEVKVVVPNLPSHNTLKITVEILVHDSWDGNIDDMGGPDVWYMKLDGQQVVHTTFSNSPCNSLYCMYQSFPSNYPRFNEPKTGAERTDLPGRCQYSGVMGWTSLYRITKLVPHKGGTVELLLGDELKQENTGDPLCDESWSITKIEVSALTVK